MLVMGWQWECTVTVKYAIDHDRLPPYPEGNGEYSRTMDLG